MGTNRQSFDDIDTNNIISTVGPYIKKAVLFGGVGLVALAVVSGSYFTVAQNQVGAVTRLGELVSSAPVTPGPHFKLPFVDTAHTVRVSMEKLPISEVKAKTVDNQFVKVDLNLSYHVGDPFKVLFKVGDVGDAGVHDKVIPYVQSRVLDELGKISALQITDNKGVIEAGIFKDIKEQILALYGIAIDDVQITAINYDPSFEENIQQMVKTRNAQVSAKNMLDVRTTEALTVAAIAKGEADAAIAKAEGEKQSAIKQAESQARQIELKGQADAISITAVKAAEAEGIRKVGDAEAEVVKAKVTAAGEPGIYAEILRAEGSKNWKGDVPTYSFGGGGTSPILPVLQIPTGKDK